jgi:phospholipid/cholesterol/gamma-HCH transport system substrate-binding protein
MEEKDRRFINLERKIGAFVVLALVGMVVAVLFIGLQQDIFTKSGTISIVADSATNLSEGLPVKYKGFRIGKVRKVSLDEQARVEVKLAVFEKYLGLVKQDSVATLLQEGVIGDNIISISPGTPEASPVEPGGSIYFRRATGISDIAEKLKDRVETAIDQVEEILSYINDPEGDVKSTLRNLNTLTRELHQTRRKLDTVLTDTSGLITDVRNDVVPGAAGAVESADEALQAVEQTVTEAEALVKDISARVPVMLDEATGTLRNAREITEDIKRATPRVPELMDQGGDLMEDTGELMDAVKKTWPIRNYVEEPEDRELRPDTYE